MNFFESELRKLFADASTIDNPTFVGRSCFGEIGNDLRVRIEFADPRTVNNYTSLRVSILNRTAGVVDRMEFRLDELLGIKQVPHNTNFPNGVQPYIWVYNGEAQWYAFTPNASDYKIMRTAVGRYVDVFRTREERKPELSSVIKNAKARSDATQPSPDAKDITPESTR